MQDFQDRCQPQECLAFLVAALLHDVGHYPYAHAIEDMRLQDVPKHETIAEQFLNDEQLQLVLEKDFDLSPNHVFALLNPKHPSADQALCNPLLASMLSGPIDIDKLDYLDRDSMHAGVPYGRNFDQARLIGQLCIDTERNRLAITEKGTTAAEMMVFARYIMFSEVYWHHTVRSATAMLQRCVYELEDRQGFLQQARSLSESQFQDVLLAHARQTKSADLAEGLFGKQRQLYKRVAQYDVLSASELHRSIARRPFTELVALSERLADILSTSSNEQLSKCDVIIDAPPAKLEVQFDVRVRIRDGSFRPLGELSPVVQTLATHQFDNIVKRVRVFVPRRLKEALRGFDLSDSIAKALG